MSTDEQEAIAYGVRIANDALRIDRLRRLVEQIDVLAANGDPDGIRRLIREAKADEAA